LAGNGKKWVERTNLKGN